MTKLEVITEAGRRLADTSTEFLTVLSSAFDFVMRDLASAELIEPLELSATFTVTVDTRTFSTVTIAGTTLPPIRILKLRVDGWQQQALIHKAESDLEFERARNALGLDYRGRWRLWRTSPNRGTLEVWPPADAQAVTDAAAETDATLIYLAPPTALADGDPIVQVADEDLETLVFGVWARCAQHKEETMQDVQMATAMYENGKAQMHRRKFSAGPNRIAADGFWW